MIYRMDDDEEFFLIFQYDLNMNLSIIVETNRFF